MPDYQQVERAAVNKGINLRDEPEAIPDGQWRRLTNVRSFSEGSLTTRPGRRWVAGVANGSDVHTLTKLGSKIISASGTKVYHNDVAYPTTFNGSALHVVRHKASDGNERWLYVSDGSSFRMLAEDGSDIKWGITAPAEQVTATAFGTGVLNSGAPTAFLYNWRAVYKNTRTGAKSNPSPVAAGLSVVNQRAKVVAMSSLDGQVDTVEFYRQGGLNGLADWRLVGSAPNRGLDPSTNTPFPVEFEDNISDAAAVRGFVLRLDNDVPFTTVALQGGNTVREAVFSMIWGPLDGKYIFAAGDPNRPGDVYWTNAGRPHSASPSNRISVSPPDEPIVGGFVYGGVSHVWTRENLYALDFRGDDALVTFVPRRTFCGRGLSLQQAFAIGPWVWFFSKDGVYLTDGQSPAEPFTEVDLRPVFNPQVEDRTYVAPGALAEVAWPPYTILGPSTRPDTGRREPEPGAVYDFTVSASPAAQTVPIGGTATINVTVSAADRFYGTVNLHVPVEPPAGVSFGFEPASGSPGTGSFTSVLTVRAVDTAQPGTLTFQVMGRAGTSGVQRLSDPITLTISGTPAPPPSVGTFRLVVNPFSTAISRTEIGTVNLHVLAEGDFNEAVTLAVSTPPTGVSVSLSSVQVTPPSRPTVATIQVSDFAVLGSQTITFTGTTPDGTVKTASLLVLISGAPGEPPPTNSIIPAVRITYGGQELHVHYRDVLGQWVHLRNHLPYSRWTNDESPEIVGHGSVYESISFFDEEQANTALLIGTNTGLVALETGTFDYEEGQKIQCRVRDRSDNFGAPRTLKEFGNIIVEADCGDAVLPAAVDATQPSGIAIIPYLDSESKILRYQRIAGTGRQRFPRALETSNGNAQVFAYSLALDFAWNGNATVYGWLTQFHPDEEYITHWSFGPTTHGLRGWQFVRDAYLMIHNPFGIVTPTVVVDGVTYPITLDDGSTVVPAGTKRKVHLWGPPVKGKVFRWDLSGIQFKLYGNESEIRTKEIASGLGFQVLSPFAGGTAEV